MLALCSFCWQLLHIYLNCFIWKGRGRVEGYMCVTKYTHGSFNSFMVYSLTGLTFGSMMRSLYDHCDNDDAPLTVTMGQVTGDQAMTNIYTKQWHPLVTQGSSGQTQFLAKIFETFWSGKDEPSGGLVPVHYKDIPLTQCSKELTIHLTGQIQSWYFIRFDKDIKTDNN